MDWNPAGPRLLCKQEEILKTTASGIKIVTDERLEKGAMDRGTVVAIGPLAWKDWGDGTPWCKIGDYVMWAKYAGKQIVDPLTKEVYQLINDEDVIGVRDGSGSDNVEA